MWFYALHNQQQGPVEEEQLKLLLLSRTIDSSSLVWREGMAQWTPLGQTELVKFLPAAVAMPAGAPVVPVVPPTPGYSPADNPLAGKTGCHAHQGTARPVYRLVDPADMWRRNPIILIAHSRSSPLQSLHIYPAIQVLAGYPGRIRADYTR